MNGGLTRGEVKAFYDRFSASYLLGDFKLINLRHRAIKQLCRSYVPRGARVLEIGCGAGILTRELQAIAREVLSIDISDVNIAVASTYANGPNGRFIRGDVTEMGAAELSGPFDAVLLADVIEHIPIERHAALFKVLRSVLAPNGIVLITFPTEQYQEHLKRNQPQLLQAVDETVSLQHLLTASSLSPIYFAYRRVFGENQYAHLVLAADPQYRAMHASLLSKGWLRFKSLGWHARNAGFLRKVGRRLSTARN
jgi:trans-aconitate 2-methyltransferase